MIVKITGLIFVQSGTYILTEKATSTFAVFSSQNIVNLDKILELCSIPVNHIVFH